MLMVSEQQDSNLKTPNELTKIYNNLQSLGNGVFLTWILHERSSKVSLVWSNVMLLINICRLDLKLHNTVFSWDISHISLRTKTPKSVFGCFIFVAKASYSNLVFTCINGINTDAYACTHVKSYVIYLIQYRCHFYFYCTYRHSFTSTCQSVTQCLCALSRYKWPRTCTSKILKKWKTGIPYKLQ